MQLFELLKALISLGYKITFDRLINQLQIILTDNQTGNKYECALLLSDHFTEEKIVAAIMHMKEELNK